MQKANSLDTFTKCLHAGRMMSTIKYITNPETRADCPGNRIDRLQTLTNSNSQKQF